MSHRIFSWMIRLLLGLVMVAIAYVPRPVRAAGFWYVTPTGDDNNDCLSPGTPCATINGAINKAVNGDTIYVATGIYTGTGNEVVLIDKDITLSGGWDPSFATQSGLSTIDGQKTRGDITTINTVVVDHFNIQNGLAFAGAGIWNGGALTINNSVLKSNSAIGFIINSPGGGGIYNGATATLNSVTLTGNSGSGITSEGTLFIHNSEVSDNDGYGISVEYGYTAVIDHSTVSNNTNDGIFNRFDLILTSSIIKNNLGHGIQNWNNRKSVLNNSTVSGNKAGGILQIFEGNLILDSTTISGNTADSGGGISIQGGSVTMQNTIVAGNTANNGPDCSGTLNTLGYNLIGNTSGCTFAPSTGDLTDVDPNLGQLIAPSGVPSYHPLLSGSPAIDAGNPTGCTDQDGNLLVVDQRGASRVGSCDIGAYEYTVPGPAAKLSAVGGNNQRTATTQAFPQALQAAALDSQGSPVSGVSIDFTAPGSGASGTFADTGSNTTSAITDAGGVATTSMLTANNAEGVYTVSASSGGLGSVTFRLEQIARPANDDFASAQPIASLPLSATVNITEATNEPNEPQSCYAMDRTVWYSFTPSQSIVVQATAAGSDIGANINIYQATGPGISDLQFLLCTGPNDTPTFHVEANQTYYVQAGAIFGKIGVIQLHLVQIPPPANDNFASPTVIPSLPFDDPADVSAASAETNEPTPSCASNGLSNTVWYAFTSNATGSITGSNPASSFNPVLAVYTGNSLTNLTEVGCQMNGSPLTFHAEAGKTYYFQAGMENGSGYPSAMQFHVEVTPPPEANFYYNPSNPSVFDTIAFSDLSSDPGEAGFQSFTWNFGDGTIATGGSAYHQYAKDGDYAVQHSVTTVDGRTDSTSQIIQVRTHDVGITKVTAPKSASTGQTKSITVAIRNSHYAETVTVELYKSTPGGDVQIGSLTLQVPVLAGSKTKLFTFNYTFTSQDAQVGKVTFRAVATINGPPDAFPADNTGISSPPTKVTR